MATYSMATAPEFARPLSPYERLFLAVDEVNGFNFCIAISFSGTVAHQRWRAALDAVQRRHPLFNAALNRDDRHNPFFVSVRAEPIPLRFSPRITPAAWQRVMEAEMARPFDLGCAPWLRATVLEDAHGCDLVLTVHHMILDGIGLLGVAREIVAKLAGHPLSPMPVPCSSEEQLSAIKAMRDGNGASSPLPPPAIPSRPSTARKERHGAPSISGLRLSPRDSARLLAGCRQHETTLGSLLLAAILHSLRDLSPEFGTREINTVIPIDARPYLENASDVVLAISGARATCAALEPTVWSSAKALRDKLLPYQSLVEIEAYFHRIAEAMALNLDAHTLIDVMGQQAGHDLILTNLKHVDFPHLPSELGVEAVWGPSVLAGFVGEHTVGVATSQGAVHLLYTSHTPLEGLLQSVEEKLADCSSTDA